MRIIPAIDIIEGKCVRLSKGEYASKKIYNENPLEVAKQFEDNGLKYLHLVDLDGAKSKHIVNHKVLEQIALKTNLIIDFGGGIKTDHDLKIAFECGAAQITAGSIAVANPELVFGWLKKFGATKIILGADAKNKKIATQGWTESSETDVVEFIKHFEQKGFRHVISTDISKDGMLQGAAVELYREILSQSNVQLIASGGVSSIDDLMDLKQIGCEGAIVGKAIYENRISLRELIKFSNETE